METETHAVPFSNLTVSADAVAVLPNVSAIPVYEASGKYIPRILEEGAPFGASPFQRFFCSLVLLPLASTM